MPRHKGLFGDLGRVMISWEWGKASLKIVIPGALVATIVWLILTKSL